MFPETCQPVGLFVGRRYLAKIGNFQRREVLLAPYLRVEQLTDDKYAKGQSEAQQKRDHKNLTFFREGGSAAAVWLLHHTGVVGGKGLRQFVLLALLQQEQIKCLLDFLLTFHREEIFRLIRISGNLACRRGFLPAGIGHPGAKRGDVRIDRDHDIAFQRAQRLRPVLNNRVGLARRFQQAVALDDNIVVFSYVRLDISVDDADIHWQRPVERVALQLSAHHLGYGDLVVEINDCIPGLGRLRHIHACGNADIRKKMFRLIRRYVRIHISKFFLKNAKPLVDEPGCRNGNLVFVLNPSFVIYLNQSRENIICLSDGGTRYRNVNNRRLIVAESRRHLGRQYVGRSLDRIMTELHILSHEPICVPVRLYHYQPDITY